MKTLARALIFGMIMVAYMRFFALPFWPALGLLVLADVLSALLALVFVPTKPKKSKP